MNILQFVLDRTFIKNSFPFGVTLLSGLQCTMQFKSSRRNVLFFLFNFLISFKFVSLPVRKSPTTYRGPKRESDGRNNSWKAIFGVATCLNTPVIHTDPSCTAAGLGRAALCLGLGAPSTPVALSQPQGSCRRVQPPSPSPPGLPGTCEVF